MLTCVMDVDGCQTDCRLMHCAALRRKRNKGIFFFFLVVLFLFHSPLDQFLALGRTKKKFKNVKFSVGFLQQT